ncbi:thiol reductant ABC exporter subunit CydD [Desulfoscipio geothermicus]|uniref:ATP-binding cassette, subfamily C, CydD n=1 Tax=Desulfoscipio geothermicus DSM 3669 TaxID=1121426 RepID=A0A1I6D7H6_9FIRM|nr:thiol reductant ABC exporter subunit CydD [Desulfoscipio geothermicus]SFR01368.1 ATP-binding cassette, subfamily C, CydD [Desulfoscipio geothermicus DSM 3669]
MMDKRLMREAGAVRSFLALSVGLGLGTGLLAILQASYLARVVNRVSLEGQSLSGVWPWLYPLLGVIIFRAGLTWMGEVVAHRAAAQIKHALRQRLLAHLLALGPVYAGGERTGELVNALVEGIEALDAYFTRYLPQLALAALVPLAVLGFVFPLDTISGLILLFTAPLIPLFMFLIGRWAESLSQRQWETLSRMSAHFLDVLQGLTTLKIFGRSKSQAEVIGQISSRFRETTLGVLRVAFLSALVLEFLATISTALVAVTVGLRLVYAHIPFEQAFFLLLLAPEFYLPLRLLGSHFHAGLMGVSAAGRIFAILETPLPERKLQGECHLSHDPSFQIAFEDVHYAFEDGARPALQGISFELHSGERVALVGPSGAGKSTAAHLLLQFMAPDRGRITVNGIPLDRIPVEEWRRHIALVPQKPYFFYGTVAENIRLGRPGAALEEVAAAAEQAGAHQFILDLPQGYDTQVGEGGIRLSGGQAQRLAVARAFLKNAPLLILDEATAGLDPVNERLVLEALERLMQGRTALIIAHRLNTVHRADRIIVLERGRVAETGRHKELIEQQGVYHRLIAAFGGAG